MIDRQLSPDLDGSLALRAERLGPLPLINHVIGRLGLDEELEKAVATTDPRVRVAPARALGVLVRSILVEREPIYRQQEMVNTFAPGCFGLSEATRGHVGDDVIGRALDRLFDADRASLLTAVVVAVGERFGLSLAELHNDSTSVRFCGRYALATGRRVRGIRAPAITYGHSKDHRSDLKQLLFILTTSGDGGVPVQFRCEAGNTNDDRTHIETWDALCRVTGDPGFLYVADSKLCNRDALDHIDRRRGRFLCVMPRSRKEDKRFRRWLQTHDPAWELVRDRPNPRQRGGPRDRWWTFRESIPSAEGWPIVWVRSALLALHQEQSRRERIAVVEEALEELRAKLASPHARHVTRQAVMTRVDALLRKQHAARYVKVKLRSVQEESFKQERPGRPGANTRYVRKVRRHWRPEWEIDEAAIAYDKKSDGMYPLLTNDRELSNAQFLDAHKRQPTIEKRFEQVKSVFEIAPVLLKSESRIEALFFVYFLTLLVQALVERELRLGMLKARIEDLPIYPEDRPTRHPTAEQVFRLFSLAQRQVLLVDGEPVRAFPPELTPLQRRVLDLLGISETVYTSPT